MQLNLLGQAIRPLTLAAGIALAGPMMYADLDQYSAITSVITSHRTESYLRQMDSNENKYQRYERRFKLLLQLWKQKTEFLSSAKSIVDNEEFKGIVAMGYDVVPFILDSIEQEPSQLVWALNYIYGVKISNNPNTTVKEACKLWVKRLRS
jgi:hypothetical protein